MPRWNQTDLSSLVGKHCKALVFEYGEQVLAQSTSQKTPQLRSRMIEVTVVGSNEALARTCCGSTRR